MKADDALILAGNDPQRIGIGTGTDTHGLHLLCYGGAPVSFRGIPLTAIYDYAENTCTTCT